MTRNDTNDKNSHSTALSPNAFAILYVATSADTQQIRTPATANIMSTVAIDGGTGTATEIIMSIPNSPIIRREDMSR